jgi:hypothetical protein
MHLYHIWLRRTWFGLKTYAKQGVMRLAGMHLEGFYCTTFKTLAGEEGQGIQRRSGDARRPALWHSRGQAAEKRSLLPRPAHLGPFAPLRPADPSLQVRRADPSLLGLDLHSVEA